MSVTIAVAQVAANTSIGNQDITASLGGLTPKAAILTITEATANGTPVDDNIWSIGFTDGTNHFCFCPSADDAVGTSDTGKRMTADPIMTANAVTRAVEARGTFVSWIANGIRINWASGEVPGAAFLIDATFFAGDISVDVNRIAAPTSIDATVDITSIGFEPEIVFGFYFLQMAGTADDAGAGIRSSWGVAHNTGASVIQRSIGWQDRHARVTSDCRSNFSELYFCRTVANSGAAYEMALDANTFDGSGFSITAKDGARTDTDFYWLAIKLDDTANIKLSTITTPTSTGEVTNGDPGFKPQAVITGMTMAEAVDTIDTGNTIGGSLGVGMVDKDAMFSHTLMSDSGVGTMDTKGLVDNKINLKNEDNTAGVIADMPAGDVFVPTGFVFDYSTVETNAKKWWALAIEADPAADKRSESNRVMQVRSRGSHAVAALRL